MATMPSEDENDRLDQVYRGDRVSGTPARWIYQERASSLGRLLGRHGYLPLGERRVLDIGCGSVGSLAEMMALGAQSQHLFGIDARWDHLDTAKRRLPRVQVQQGNGERLDWPDGHFYLVLLFTVISSSLDPGTAGRVASQASRVLAPGGAVLYYDFRYDNPRNRDVRGVTKRDVLALFPHLQVYLSTITLLPAVARRLGWAASTLHPLLALIPPLRIHYLGLLQKQHG